uniref:Malate dehydrogenase n=1 Tax=Timema bartmani TaxID=61472 RepID=A0A7R9F2T0_9NEOP|nr:unnamed protein product [Timema bartmani]
MVQRGLADVQTSDVFVDLQDGGTVGPHDLAQEEIVSLVESLAPQLFCTALEESLAPQLLCTALDESLAPQLLCTALEESLAPRLLCTALEESLAPQLLCTALEESLAPQLLCTALEESLAPQLLCTALEPLEESLAPQLLCTALEESLAPQLLCTALEESLAPQLLCTALEVSLAPQLLCTAFEESLAPQLLCTALEFYRPNILNMSKDFLVCPHEMRIFVHDTLVRLKVADDHVTNMADMIVNADMRGHFGHGLARLEISPVVQWEISLKVIPLPATQQFVGLVLAGPRFDKDVSYFKYAEELMSGVCDGRARPKLIRSTESTAWVDGNLAPGASVGVYCMHLAVQRARDSGAALVAVKRTGHLGPGAWYTTQALESGMIGLVFSSSLRRTIVPSGSRQAGLGENRLCVSAPAQQGDSLDLDIVTCEGSTSKIRSQSQRKRGIPPDPDEQGSVCDVETGKLLPLGGASQDLNKTRAGRGRKKVGECVPATLVAVEQKDVPATHSAATSPLSNFIVFLSKGIERTDLLQRGFSTSIYPPYHVVLSGSALTILTEILGAVLASTRGDSACFIVLNPERFTSEFQVLLSEYLNSLRHLEPVEPRLPVLVPGDSERLFQRRVRREKGIRYDEKVIQKVNRLADELYVRRLRPSRSVCNCHTSIRQQVCSQSPK